MTEPISSERFDMNDIRALRDYNSERHIKMTHEEIIADTSKGAKEMLKYMSECKKTMSKGLKP